MLVCSYFSPPKAIDPIRIIDLKSIFDNLYIYADL